MTTDADLEKAIDMAGRDMVFALARENGWRSGDHVPKYIWWQICGELMNKQLVR